MMTVPVVLFLVGATLELVAILILNDGHLIYTLDDAYIHLSLAENIWHGTYGVNPGECSAPSSSVLWPFLLVPFVPLSTAAYAPLVLNLCAAIATLPVFRAILADSFGSLNQGDRDIRLPILVALLIPATNLIPLVFTGMEHSLQVLLATLLLLGLVREANTRCTAWWLIPAVIVGPLVRYESLALSLPALLYLFLRGHRRVSLLSGMTLAIVLGGFSLFLVTLGLQVLPTSAIAKSLLRPVDPDGYLLWEGFLANLANPRGLLCALGMLLCASISLVRSRPHGDRLLAGSLALALALHLCFGQYGWYNRYEIYIWTSSILGLVYLLRDPLGPLLSRLRVFQIVILASLIIGLSCAAYIRALITTPIASNNIYEQQYQMHRFATEYYRAPVAVNDLGWVAYQNDQYVLDLAGVNSMDVLRARLAGHGPGWMNDFASRHGAQLAMIYKDWFPDLPKNWTPIAALHLGKRRVSVAGKVVTFYALDRDARVRANRLLNDFGKTLPEGVRLERFVAADSE